MKLATIEKIWYDLNNKIFAVYGSPLPEIRHYRTRAADYWACYDENRSAYYWNKKLDGHKNICSLVAHEMVHHWQAVYYADYYESVRVDYNPHDVLFFSWNNRLSRHGLILLEHM